MSVPHYQIIRRPIITEKGLGVKETQHTVVFEVASGATKTQIKEAVRGEPVRLGRIFGVEILRFARQSGPAQDDRARAGEEKEEVEGRGSDGTEKL